MAFLGPLGKRPGARPERRLMFLQVFLRGKAQGTDPERARSAPHGGCGHLVFGPVLAKNGDFPLVFGRLADMGSEASA